MNEYDVFISYRRSLSTDRAQHVCDVLSKTFHSERIFLDTIALHEGPFPDSIRDAIGSVKYFILLISSDSFERKEESDIDYFYEEIRLALHHYDNRGLKIIPVVYDDINFGRLVLPEDLNRLKLHNAISVHADDPAGLDRRLLEYTRKRKREYKDWLVFPLAVFTIYATVSLLSGLGLYVCDNCFTDYDEAVEIASENIVEHEGLFYYALPDGIVAYNPENSHVDFTPVSSSHNARQINIAFDDMTGIGFWTTATALVYNMMKVKYKPHGGKQLMAYVATVVAIVAGVGLGGTIERMIFPLSQCSEICKNAGNADFWNDVVNKRYSQPQRLNLKKL